MQKRGLSKGIIIGIIVGVVMLVIVLVVVGYFLISGEKVDSEKIDSLPTSDIEKLIDSRNTEIIRELKCWRECIEGDEMYVGCRQACSLYLVNQSLIKEINKLTREDREEFREKLSIRPPSHTLINEDAINEALDLFDEYYDVY